MKILFIGEGRHDIGPANRRGSRNPRPATGVVPTLARKICPDIDEDSIALAWKNLERYPKGKKKKLECVGHGYEKRLPAAMAVAHHTYNCDGVIAVVDQDKDRRRKNKILEGVNNSQEILPEFPIAIGLAIRSIEAWTLGAKKALAAETGRDISEIEECFPKGKAVEDLNPSSGKEEQQPKSIVKRIAKLANRDDCLDFRRAVAARTDITELEEACPRGFAPFANEVRSAFGNGAAARTRPAR